MWLFIGMLDRHQWCVDGGWNWPSIEILFHVGSLSRVCHVIMDNFEEFIQRRAKLEVKIMYKHQSIYSKDSQERGRQGPARP